MNSLSLSIRSSIQSPLHPPGSSNFGAERGEVNLSILANYKWNYYNKHLVRCQGSPNRDLWDSVWCPQVPIVSPAWFTREDKIRLLCTRSFQLLWSPQFPHLSAFASLLLVRLSFAVRSFLFLSSSPLYASTWNQRSSGSAVDQVLITYI